MAQYPYPQQPPPQKSGSGAGFIILVVVLPALIAIIGILAVLAIYGVRKYIANAKQAEARNALGQIGRDAVAAYERDKRVCPSASQPVPAIESMVSGKKYASSAADWEIDKSTSAGFSCLGFSMAMPQYYQYVYKATPTGFTATARGDLDGDGVFSELQIEGKLAGGVLSVAPAIKETNASE